jgi:hypothetical protein
MLRLVYDITMTVVLRLDDKGIISADFKMIRFNHWYRLFSAGSVDLQYLLSFITVRKLLRIH